MEEKILGRLDELISQYKEITSSNLIPGTYNSVCVEPNAFTKWKTSVESFLIRLTGVDSVYYKNFSSCVGKSSYQEVKKVSRAGAVLLALKEDIESGLLKSIEDMVSADVFSDFLEMAEYLLEQGYKDPAASLTGATLENEMRRMCQKRNIKIKKNDNLNSLNTKLVDKKVYNRLKQKKIKVWIDLRDNADHGHFEEYSLQDVTDMIKGVRDFLTEYH